VLLTGPWSNWLKAKPGRNISYAIAFMPSGMGITLADVAAGKHDSHFVTLANNLAKYGMLNAYLRPGWEMDGGWYAWTAKPGNGRQAHYAAAFRRVVTVMRQAQPTNKWKIIWNPTDLGWPDVAYLESIWPGDAFVDVVGVDCYDQLWWSINGVATYYPSTCDSACQLSRQKAVWSHRLQRLNILRDFAIKHGKTMGFPEWALVDYSVASGNDGHGGLDNPYFIQKMHDFFVDPANKVVMQAYFNFNNSTHDLALSNFPKSGALFKQLFGAGSD
jgi:Glycosyl hydrolase family 26